MSKIATVKKLWKKDKWQIMVAVYNKLVHAGVTNFLSDSCYLRLTYRLRFRKSLNLKNPQTFNEKMQWLKLYDRNPHYTALVDKVKVKEYIASIIGEEYVIKTLGVWDDFEQIDFNKLPNQFVLKCNHDSGSVVICKDKDTFNMVKARKKIMTGLRKDAFFWGREWPYKNVERKIIAEEYMIDKNHEELLDYKFMCFHGKVKCLFVCTERYTQDGLKVTFFDTNWNVMPFERYYPKSDTNISQPLNYHKMIELAEKLSKNIPFLRVDFYEINGQIYFGELTFYPGSGWEPFTPEEWDMKLGQWIDLSYCESNKK